MNGSDDQKWLREFARSGDEGAFRRLVDAHTGMVFGTALRIVREQMFAEEVAQNVFIALARKAPFFPRDVSVGAWLHRCAVLEAKNLVRGEIRRRRREESVGGRMTDAERSVLEALAPELDEALLELREPDRAALLLRYLQGRSLKEVGQSLGVSEDTAQKRVAKGVELLGRVFRKRGYSVPGTGAIVALLEGSLQAVPSALGQTLAAAALHAAAPASLGGAMVAAAKFMSLTKTQTVAVCLLVASTPIGVQWNIQREAQAALRGWEQTMEVKAARQQELEERTRQLRREIALAHAEILAGQAELSRAAAAPQPALPPPEQLYAWSPNSEFVRLPKGLLDKLKLTPRRELYPPGAAEPMIGRGEVLSDDGEISPVLLEALGLDAAQAGQVQQAFLNFSAQFQAAVQTRTYVTNAMPPGTNFHRPENAPLVTLHTPSFPEEGERLKSELQDALAATIGPDRADILLNKQAASDLKGSYLDFGKSEKWIAAARQENGYYTLAKSRVSDGMSLGGSVSTVRYEGLPEELKALLPPPAKE